MNQVHKFQGITAVPRSPACSNFGQNGFSPWVHRRSLGSPACLARQIRMRLADKRLRPVDYKENLAGYAAGDLSEPCVDQQNQLLGSAKLSLGNPD
jgi:hypothetical protein